MGNEASMPAVDGFAKEEIQRLEKRFQKLDVDKSGSISVGEFLSVPEIKENPLVKRVVDVFDSDMSGDVDFKGEMRAVQLLLVFDMKHAPPCCTPETAFLFA